MVAVVVFSLAVVVLVLLWRWIDGLALADPGQKDKATAQLDAVKIAASIVVAGGGLFALYLAARRQRTQERELQARHAELAQRDRAQAHTEQVAADNRRHAERVSAAAEKDAAARQVTELYTKAVEQLGHEQAAVRLGGLYVLERLAQDLPEQRRPVVSVLCAYLRMPYLDPDQPAPRRGARRRGRADHRPATARTPPRTRSPPHRPTPTARPRPPRPRTRPAPRPHLLGQRQPRHRHRNRPHRRHPHQPQPQPQQPAPAPQHQLLRREVYRRR
ncbi:hypothetical protein [Amycolatopsis magusensis]|uniref:hypothetical protein n=1 Tax=Amycolatopsis magusensis TaxID=882444 RepID=UPI0037A84A7B